MRHVREVKLQWDSNKSDYNPLVNTSLLANRYVLLNMFGKGGFAEVLCYRSRGPTYIMCQHVSALSSTCAFLRPGFSRI